MAGNNQRLILIGLKELVGVRNARHPRGVGDRTLRQVSVGGLQRAANGLETDVVRVELIGIHFHAYRRARTAHGRNLTDAVDLREFLRQDRIRRIVDLRGRNVFRGEREKQDGRVRGIGLAIGRLPGQIGRELAARRIDGCLNVARRGVDVAVQVKLQRDSRGAQPARRRHLRNAGDAAELALQRRGYGRSHGLRTRAREIRADRNCREIHLRQRRYGQKTKRHQTGKKNCQRDQRSRDRPPNEGNREAGGDVHELVSRSPGGIAVRRSRNRFIDGIADVELEAMGNPIKREVNDRRSVQRENLAEDQAANNGDTQRPAKLGANTGAERQRQAAEQCRHGGHHDRAETQQARFVNGIQRRLPFLAFGFEREVDHHNGVFLDDADQQNDADQRDDAELCATQQQSENRAHTRGGQRRKNGDGMDVAFIENAENDVNGDQRGENQDRLVGKRAQEGRGRSLERGLNAWRHAELVFDAVDGVDGFAQRGIGSQIEGKGDYRKLSLVIDRQGGVAGLEARKCAERNLCCWRGADRPGRRADGGDGTGRWGLAGGRAHVDIFQRVGILLELRIDLQHYVVLIELRENRGDQALAERVVKRVVDVRGENAQPRSRVAIDGQHCQEPAVLLVARHVAQFRERLELVHEARYPIGQLFAVHVFQAVLELRAADAVLDRQVLHRLHEQRNAIDLLHLRLQPANHVRSGNLALLQRLKINLDAAAVERRVRAIDPDEGRQALDRRVFQDDIGQRALSLGHRLERNVLRSFGYAQDRAGVLHRKETLGHIDVQKDRADQRRRGDQQRGGAVTQHKFQRPAVKRDDGIKGVLRVAVKPTLFFFLLVAQQLGGHHRRKRNECRNDDGHRQRNRKFAEEPADDVAHEEQGNEHGNQRNGEREDGEADLLGALQSRLQRSVALLDVAGDVLDHDDGVVHHEARGNGERHERKIVQAVAQQIHHAEGAHNRERHCKAGNNRGANAAQEQEDDQHDEHDGQHQRELHVCNRSANGGGTVGKNLHLHRRRKRALQLRQQLLDAIDDGNDVSPRLALDIQDDRGSLVGPRCLLHVFRAVHDGRNVREAHRRPVSIRDDQRPIAVAGDELVVCANGVSLMRAVECSFGLVHIRLRQGRAQILEA